MSRISQSVSLPKCHCRRLVAAMIISRLHYCNSVFAGLPADQVARLQRIQNNAVRLVMKKKKKRRKKERKENRITLHLFSKNFTGYLWNSAASIKSRLWPIAISKGLYLLIFLHPSSFMNHLGLSDIPNKSYLKFPSETWNLSGKVLSVLCVVFGTHYQPISEIC